MRKPLCIGGPRDGRRLQYDSQYPYVAIVIRNREQPDGRTYDSSMPVVPDFRVARYYPTWCCIPKTSASGFRGRRFLFLRFEKMNKQKAVNEFAERELGALDIFSPTSHEPH